MVLEDDILVKKCLGGEKDAFGVLVSKYKDAVYGLAYSKVRNFHDAQDIAQESFIDAYKNLRSLKHPHRFNSWIYTIAANRCRMWLRKQPHEFLAFASDERPEPEMQAAHRNDKGQILDSVLDAINELPDATRLVMTLYYIDGLTCKEIGEFTGTSINTVMSKLRRARAKLRKEFTEMPAQTMTQQKVPLGFTTGILSAIERLAPVPQPPSSINRIIQTPWFVSLIIGIVMMGGLYISSPGDPHNMWENIRTDRIYPSLSKSYGAGTAHQVVELLAVSVPAKNTPDDAQAVLWKVDGKEIKGDGQYPRIVGDTAEIDIRVRSGLVSGGASGQLIVAGNSAQSSTGEPLVQHVFRYGSDDALYGVGGIQLWYRYDDDLYPGGIDNDHDGYPDNGDRMNSRRDYIDNDWDGTIDEAQTDKDGNDRKWAEVNTWQYGEIEYDETDSKTDNGWFEITLQWDVSDLKGEFQYEFLLVADLPSPVDFPGRPFERNDAMRSKIIIDHPNSHDVVEIAFPGTVQYNLWPGEVFTYKIRKEVTRGNNIVQSIDSTQTLLVMGISPYGVIQMVSVNQDKEVTGKQKRASVAGIRLMYMGSDGRSERGPNFRTTLSSGYFSLDSPEAAYFVPFPQKKLSQGGTWSYRTTRPVTEYKYTVTGVEEIGDCASSIILEREEILSADAEAEAAKTRIACEMRSGMIITFDSEVIFHRASAEGETIDSIERITLKLIGKERLNQDTLAAEEKTLEQIKQTLAEDYNMSDVDSLNALRNKLVEVNKQYPSIHLAPGIAGMIASVDQRIADVKFCSPNPFKPDVHKKLTFDTSAHGIMIHNYEAQLIRTLSGSEWDGTDEDGQPVPPGIYFYNAKVDGGSKIGQIGLIR